MFTIKLHFCAFSCYLIFKTKLNKKHTQEPNCVPVRAIITGNIMLAIFWTKFETRLASLECLFCCYCVLGPIRWKAELLQLPTVANVVVRWQTLLLKVWKKLHGRCSSVTSDLKTVKLNCNYVRLWAYGNKF